MMKNYLGVVRPCLITVLLVIAATLISGCGTFGTIIAEGKDGRVIIDVPPEEGYGYYETRLPHIPAGHMPPPGMCRIWYPGLPPGHQPPPGPCHELQGEVPQGAWLIYGGHEHDRGKGNW